MINSIKVGLFLAIRQIRRASAWTTGLIIFVMILTFLNLVVVSGILIGLIDGSSIAYRSQYSGDILISTPKNKNYIEESMELIKAIKSLPETESYTARYLIPGQIESNYKEIQKPTEVIDSVNATIAGIEPDNEESVTKILNQIIEGSNLHKEDVGYALIGSNLLEQYSGGGVPGVDALKGINIGSKIRIVVAGKTKELIIKGIIKSKIQEIGRRVFIVDSELRKIIERQNFNVNEIAIKLKPNIDPKIIASALKRQGFDKNALIRTWEESQGTFYNDIKKTFAMLSNFIGGVGLAVAAITVFIVVFINAITRKKFIGILKGIGISGLAIEISYVVQSTFYALIGSGLGLIFLYAFLKPFFDANPINFPFSDGILVAEPITTAIRVGLIIISTIVAGFVPARIIVKKNTLDSILGR